MYEKLIERLRTEETLSKGLGHDGDARIFGKAANALEEAVREIKRLEIAPLCGDHAGAWFCSRPHMKTKSGCILCDAVYAMEEAEAEITRLQKNVEGWVSLQNQTEQQLAEARAREGRLSLFLERDRSTVAEGITAVKKALASRQWLSEGRGSYEYDDDRWKDEFGQAIEEIRLALRPLQTVASNWSDCPKDWRTIQKARAITVPAPTGEAEK